jgi:hypothetical protein
MGWGNKFEMANQSKRGGARKGSGRKSNAEKFLAAGFTAPWFGPETQKTKLQDLLNSQDERIVADITKYLLNRIYGQPPQSVEVAGKGKDGAIPIEIICDL